MQFSYSVGDSAEAPQVMLLLLLVNTEEGTQVQREVTILTIVTMTPFPMMRTQRRAMPMKATVICVRMRGTNTGCGTASHRVQDLLLRKGEEEHQAGKESSNNVQAAERGELVDLLEEGHQRTHLPLQETIATLVLGLGKWFQCRPLFHH